MSTLTLRNVKGTPLTNTEVDDNFSNLNTDKLEKDGSTTMTGKLTTVTSSASTASVRVSQGSADPTSPVSGDLWNNAGDFKFYTGSATRVVSTLDGAQTLTNKTLDAALVTNGLFFEGATVNDFETLLTVVDPSADRTVTIPDATTTMVGTDVAQTLTNKTINLANNTLTTTSALLATAISDETGTGLVVFNGSPTITTPTIAQVNAPVDFTLDAGADIILDADGADIILKDNGTEFGRLVNSGGQLTIASGTSTTTAISLNGSAVTIAGDLTVNGTTTTVNSTTVDIDDINLTVAKGNSTNIGADGAGLTVEATTGGNKTWTFNNSTTSWTSSENINIVTGKNYLINGSQIAASNLSNGTTGSGSVVLASSPSLSSPTFSTPVLGTPSSGNLANCTFPTLNQNTTGSAATFTSTSQNSQFNSIGVGTAASTTAGEIRATNEITAFYSDARLKNFHGTIDNALEKVTSLNGYYFTENEVAKSLGYNNDKMQVGVSAQEVLAVLPEAVAPAPIDEQYLTVKYEKLVPVLVEAIKALKLELDEVKKNCNCNK